RRGAGTERCPADPSGENPEGERNRRREGRSGRAGRYGTCGKTGKRTLTHASADGKRRPGAKQPIPSLPHVLRKALKRNGTPRGMADAGNRGPCDRAGRLEGLTNNVDL